MRITDYESARVLNDVAIELTRDEAEELSIYLSRILALRDPKTAFLTETDGRGIARELSITIDSPGWSVDRVGPAVA